MTAKAISGLLYPVASVVGGSVELEGQNLNSMNQRQRRAIAGPGLGIVFQDALTALNPVYTVGAQLGEAFRIHRGMNKKQARLEALELMGRVGISELELRVSAYPHQLSSGIARALALDLLILDETVSALNLLV